ncbi:MAG TPA: hypothetical protein VNO52_04765, partial [Methylomirabilota bacterium]|nr:hypothetical protein [Methylomirabilota bacterium]
MRRAWACLAGLLGLASICQGAVELHMAGNSVCADGPYTIGVADRSVTGEGDTCAALTSVPPLRAGLEVGRSYALSVAGGVCSVHLAFAVPGCYRLFIDGVESYSISQGTTNSGPGEGAGSWTMELRHERGLKIEFDVEKEDGRYVLAADGVAVARPSLGREGGSTPLVAPLTWSIVSADALDCQINPTNGLIRAGEREGTLLVRVVDSSTPPCQVLEELDLRRCESCDAAMCPIGAATPELGSVSARVSLGRGWRGEHVGGLTVYTTNAAANLGAVSLLRYPFRRNAVEVITNAAGVLQQVRVPEGLAVVQVQSASSYALRFYRPEQVLPKVNGLYQLTEDAPFTTVSFSSSQAGRLLVAAGAQAPWLYLASGNDWSLVSGLPSGLSTNGLRTEKQKTTWSGPSNTVRTVTRTLLNAQGQTNAVSSRVYRRFAWGEVLEEDITGLGATALTNRYVYSPDGRRLDITRADGGWSIEFFDALGRVTNRFSAFADQTPTTNKALCRLTEFLYTPGVVAGSGDAGWVATNTPRRVTEHLLGAEIGRSYAVFASTAQGDEQRSIVCVASNAAWNHAGNLVTTRVLHAGGALAGRWRKTIFPEGTIETREFSPDERIQTVSRGQPWFAGSDTVIDGTRLVTEFTATGHLVTRTNLDIASGALTGLELFTEPDDYGRPRRVTYLDGTSTYTEFGCCGPELATDRDGATTTFTYDALRRRETETLLGVVSRTTNDAADRVLARVREGTDGTRITQARHAYDLAGRLTNSWDAVGQPTRFQETNTPGRRLTTTYADGGVRVEEWFRDGALKRVTGTAAFPMRYEYGVTNGTSAGYNCFLTSRKEIKLDDAGNDTPEWTLTLTDPAGREVKTLFAAPAGQPVPAAERIFNVQGQLSREIDPDGVSTLHLYNGRGEPWYRVLDANRNGQLDWAATNGEQIVETYSAIAAGPDGQPARRVVTSVTTQDGDGTLTPVSTIETRLDGLRVWSSAYGQTNFTETTYAGTTRTVAITAPDGTVTTSTYEAGRLTGVVTHHPALNETLRALDFTYDAHGRQAGVFDQRTGLTTNVFDAADRLQSTALPPAAAGEAALTTSYEYDAGGRLWRTHHPDGGLVTRTYWSNGLPRLESGARVYPNERRYDAQGRLTHQTTWADFGAGTGAVTNQWRYDAYRGWLTNRVFAGSNGVFHAYTNSGRLVLRRWARGVETRYGYDALGQLTVANHSDTTPDVFLTRDRLGRPARVEERGPTATNVTLLTNHLAGPLLAEARTGVLVTNGYDARLRRIRQRLATPVWNDTTTYGHDAASRLTGVTNNSRAVQYSYGWGSALVQQVIGWDLGAAGGPAARLVSERQLDALDRGRRLEHRRDDGPSTVVAGDGTGYDLAGLRPAVTNTADGSRWDFSYDALGQLFRARRYWPDATEVPGQQFEYTHDQRGNRTRRATGELDFFPLRDQYAVNGMNQLTQRTVVAFAGVAGRAASHATVTVNNGSVQRHGPGGEW